MYRRILNPLAARLGRLSAKLVEDDAVLLDLERQLQPDGFSCGVYAALMILKYHGKSSSPNATARALGTDEDGTSQGPILSLFRKRGLKPIIKTRATLRDLREGIDNGAPALVSVKDASHWSVVYGYSRSKFYLADPSVWGGIRPGMPNSKFRSHWDRWAMVVNQR